MTVQDLHGQNDDECHARSRRVITNHSCSTGGGGAIMLLWGNKGHSDNSLTVGVSDTLVVVDFTDI